MAQIVYNTLFKFNFPTIAKDLITFAIDSDCLDSIIIIVPTGKLERKLKQDAVREYYEKYQKPIPSINAFTLNGFVEYCYDFIFEDRKRFSISEAYRMALLDEASGNANLKFYSSNKKRLSPMILERLANVIFGLKEDGITVEDLKEDILNEDDVVFYDIARLSDVVELYEKYEELLEGKYLDFPEIIRKITAHIASTDEDLFYKQILYDKKFVLINGFTDFKVPEINFISLFAKSKIPFAINIDYSTNNGPLFGNLDDYISQFKSNGFTISSPEDIEERKYLAKNSNCEINSEAKYYPRERYLRTMLFNNDSDLRNKSFSKIISIIEADNRFNEVKYIAKLTHYLIVAEGYLPKDICVCMRKPEIYSNLFREIFSLYKVPANISDRYSLASSPLIVLIFSILDIIIYDYRIDDVQKVLLNSYISFNDDNFDAKNLIAVSQRLRILGGFERGGAEFWERNIESHLAFHKKRLNYMLDDFSEQLDDIEKLNQEINSIEKALHDFKLLRKIIPQKRKNYGPKEFKELIINLILENLHIRSNIFKSFEEFLKMKNDLSTADKTIYEESIEKDARALESFIKLLNEITIITSERSPGKKFSLSELTNKLKISVSAEKYQIHEKQNMGVGITSIEQIRGISYKVLILCGAIDGEFPMSYRPETFLGKELKNTIERHIQSERIQFYQFLTNDKESLDKSEKLIYIFYPLREDSEELVRSSFVDALLKITSLKDDLRVYNIAKIQKYLSKDVSDKEEADAIQSRQLPWLKMIQSNNELFYESGSIFKASNKIEIKNNLSEIQVDTLNFIEYLIKNALRNRGIIDLGLLPNNAKRRIEKYREKPISITELETYQKCPFKLFVSKILRIQEPSVVELELSPMDIGNILHSIVYKFYLGNQTILHNNNLFEYKIDSINKKLPVILPVVLERKNYDLYLNQLIKIAKDELELFKYEHPYFYLETEKIIGTPRVMGVLERWLREEIQRFEDSSLFKPVLFEFSFGSYHSIKFKSFTEFVEIDGLKIQGKVDRVELMKTNGNYGFMIADYKNKMKGVATNSEVNKFESFQMPLYILAIEKILNDYYGIQAVPMGGIYYGFEPEQVKGRAIFQKYLITEKSNPRVPNELHNSSTQVLKVHGALREILQNSLSEAKKIVDNIINGNFPVDPKDNQTCKNCGYYSICRIKEKKNIICEFITEDNSDE